MTAVLFPDASVDVAGMTLIPATGTVALDETRAYASAIFDVRLADIDMVELIDPRNDQRAVITLELNGASRTFDLGVRSRSVDHKSSVVTITCLSDEALLSDYSPLVHDDSPVALIGSVRSIVNYVLDVVIAGAALSAGTADAAVVEVDALTWKAGTSAWEFLIGITAAAALRLFCDENRVWRLVPASYVVSGSVTAMVSNSSEGADTIDRDTNLWSQGVVAIWSWTDDDGAHEVIDAAGEPGKVETLNFRTPYPGPGAAAFRLNRLKGQGRTQTATAFSVLTATPGAVARFILPGSTEQVGRLQRVEFGMRDPFMSLQARELTAAPDTSWIFGPTGVSWNDVPVGMSWEEFDWSLV